MESTNSNLKVPIIQGTFWYKWWNNYETEKCISNVKSAINTYWKVFEQEKQWNAGVLVVTTNVFQLLFDSIKDRHLQFTLAEYHLKVLETLNEQFNESQSQFTSPSPNLIVPLSQYDNQYSCLLGESQDPYEKNQDQEDYVYHASNATMDDFFMP